MKQYLNYIILLAIILIISSGGAYYFLNQDQEKKIKKQEEIDSLQVEILNLELENLNKNFELLENYNLNVVLKKLQLAKLNEKELQLTFLDSLESNDFYENFKKYNDCVNSLYNKSTNETIKLKNQISDISQNILMLKENHELKKIIVCQKEAQNISALVLNVKKDIENICSNFDSLYYNINSYIK